MNMLLTKEERNGQRKTYSYRVLNNSFFVPARRFNLIESLSRIYPKDENKFKRYKKDQLYAIYYRVFGNGKGF